MTFPREANGPPRLACHPSQPRAPQFERDWRRERVLTRQFAGLQPSVSAALSRNARTSGSGAGLAGAAQ